MSDFYSVVIIIFPVFFERVESDMWRCFLGLTWGGTVLIAFSWDRLLHFLLRSTATTTQCFSLAVIPIFYFSHDFLFYHNAFTKPFILRCYFSSLARRL